MRCNISEIWAEYKDKLEGYIYKRVSNKDDTNDILQTVFLKILNYCEFRNDVGNIKGWVYRIAHNTIIDHYKKGSKKVNLDFNISSQEDIKISENTIFWLHSFINGLPIEYATPLMLSDIEGKPQKEVASELGLTLEATKSRIQRARKMLRHKFNECGIVETAENQTFLFTITKSCCNGLKKY